MRVKVRIKGVKPMQRQLREATARIERRSLAALETEAKNVLKQAKRLAPKLDGHLRDSGVIDPPQRQGGALVATIAFGRTGPSTAYALAHHEHPGPFSPKTWGGKVPLGYTSRGTGTKYLERPLREAGGSMNQRIASRIRL